jgi:hypothetical protein
MTFKIPAILLRRRASSLLPYGLVVGLVAVVAIVSVNSLGRTSASQFDAAATRIGDSLEAAGVSGGNGGGGGGGGGGDGEDEEDGEGGGPAVLAWSGSGSGMDVAAPATSGSTVLFTLVNSGGSASAGLSGTISLGGADPGHFSIVSNTCTGGLAAGSSCQVGVQPQASDNGAYSASLATSAENAPSVSLSGTASGFISYAFTTHDFTNCGATGHLGPAQSACRSAYATGWDEDDAFFAVAGGIQKWTVPESATYRITARGAQGGGGSGGTGMTVTADIALSGGTVLNILVGQTGGCFVGGGQTICGGGGGSFVYLDSSTPYVIAGGGGGSGDNGGGCPAVSGTTSNACGGNGSTPSSGGAGGAAGGGDWGGAGGGGWNGAGANGTCENSPNTVSVTGSGGSRIPPGTGGSHSNCPEGWGNGSSGGFGGGGAATWAPSGGGGYSGGPGRNSPVGSSADQAWGGGGSSFTGNGAAPVSSGTTVTGNGSVTITKQ